MSELQKAVQKLKTVVDESIVQLKIAEKQAELADLNKQMQASDFWSDNQTAQAVSKQASKLSTSVEPWSKLRQNVAELNELIAMNDESMNTELQTQLTDLQEKYDELKQSLKFSGKYDDHDVILSIYAGAGGTDAQDWTQMLLRMYTRWAESNQYQLETIDQSAGEEAGLKSVTVAISGLNIYGLLKGENGVHRLVRLSPFNSDNLRQTSFSKVDVMPAIERPDEVEIDEKDLKIDVYRAGGHGGQSVNTTDSAVRVTHLPTGLTVAIQNERSQLQNKETAMKILRSRLAQLTLEQHQDHLDQLKGPVQSAEWGNQIRSYVLHPYKQVKDLRTKYETSNVDDVLDGKIDGLITAYLDSNISSD